MRFFNLDRLRRVSDGVERGWPGYLFGGRVRTSTVALIIAFAALWWVYDDHQQAIKSRPKTTQVPATQVVPPGFVPDPNYTWVPRTRVWQPPSTQTQTPTQTLTLTPTTTTPTETPTTTPPPFGLPPIVLPPPFGPPVTTTSTAPGSAPAPAPPPPAPPPPAPPLLPHLPPLPGLP